MELAAGRLRVEVRLEDVVRVAVHEPDVADGQFLDVRRRIERRPVRLRLPDRRRRLVPVRRNDVVGRVAEILERGREQLVRAVEHRDAALDLLEVLGVEDHCPRVGGQSELPDLRVVVADDRRRHRIRHRVLVARVERRVQIRRIDVFDVRNRRLVERLQLPAADQRLHGVAGRHQHVVALGAGGELGEQLLVVRVIRLHDLALAHALEALDRLRSDVVVPVVEMKLVFRVRRRDGKGGDGQDGGGKGSNVHFQFSRSERSRVGDSLAATTISSNVSSISRVDTAFTSGVTEILIIE